MAPLFKVGPQLAFLTALGNTLIPTNGRDDAAVWQSELLGSSIEVLFPIVEFGLPLISGPLPGVRRVLAPMSIVITGISDEVTLVRSPHAFLLVTESSRHVTPLDRHQEFEGDDTRRSERVPRSKDTQPPTPDRLNQPIGIEQALSMSLRKARPNVAADASLAPARPMHVPPEKRVRAKESTWTGHHAHPGQRVDRCVG